MGPRWWDRRDGGLGRLREPGAVARQERIVASGKLRLIDPNVDSLRRGTCFGRVATIQEIAQKAFLKPREVVWRFTATASPEPDGRPGKWSLIKVRRRLHRRRQRSFARMASLFDLLGLRDRAGVGTLQQNVGRHAQRIG